MSYSVPRSVVHDFYAAFAARDADKVARYLDDAVEWTINGPVDVLSYCGARHGKAAVLDLIERVVPRLFASLSFVPETILVDGDRVATLSRMSARRRDGARVVGYRLAHFLRFRDDKVIEVVSLIDSFDAVEQVLGHPLPVHAAHDAEGLVAV